MSEGAFGRRGWILFAIMSVVWGITYLFIKEAVDSFSPPAVVAGRTLLGGLVLLPFALRARALTSSPVRVTRPARRQAIWACRFPRPTTNSTAFAVTIPRLPASSPTPRFA